MASRLLRLQLERVSLYAHDSRTIATTLLRSIRSTPVKGIDDLMARTKQVLLETSRQANVASIKILNGEKELNLLRYHGLQKYLQMAWQRRRASSYSIAEGGGAAETDDGRTARVAFMITSQNRQDLNRLGYSAEDIRQLTPADALLLLENRAEKKDSVKGTLQLLKDVAGRHSSHDKGNGRTAEEPVAPVEENGSHGSNTPRSLSPQIAQDIQAKADVALALVDSEVSSSGAPLHLQESEPDGPGGSDAADESSPRTDDGQTARVAFMITSKNRKDLSKLGYSTEDIRQLTPADALLLLEHRAEKKDSVKGTLQLLKDDAESDKSSSTSVQPQSSIAEDPCDDSTGDQVNMTKSVTPQEAAAAHAKPDVASALLSPHEGQQASELDEDGDCWFEVVERPPNASVEAGSGRPEEEHVIALFSSRREAEECIEVKLRLRKNASCEKDRYLVRERRI
ncbi:hypothetical protein THAOC_22671 [Thalassiosira oceanica]|uniref:Uncharacterized protein n=1 Tax=Thalassiosira oceanica TaxID=159749 RepID=K0RXW2_THAOC|nr:hypothetical protein THAOC_22671 [Thalassiosira oceanica]|eukprot:EJK57299.1 hypothetical protein THAOC_22671 [Thalassiosira oceanica]